MSAIPDLQRCASTRSGTPSVKFRGVEIHSGDILLSRGGSPASALISRGNDFPGNFSHIALVHIDENTDEISIIESQIETGVVIRSAEAYINDKKLRIMVLRLRVDLPQMVRDPLLPHKAAKHLFRIVKKTHIPYDYSMNYQDPTSMFCSEVAAHAYRQFGITLWSGLSSISGVGARSWLSSLGVQYFQTQKPTDLEYDPMLDIVAEWRSAPTLYMDHIDNAIIDVLLEGANSGEEIGQRCLFFHDKYAVIRGLRASPACLQGVLTSKESLSHRIN